MGHDPIDRPDLSSIIEEIRSKPFSQMLREKLGSRERKPLFDREALTRIKETMDKWLASCLKDEDRREFRKTLYIMLGTKERIPRPLILTPLDIADTSYEEDLGFPGLEPFTRGIHPNMYRGKKFTIRPIVGFGTPEDTNKRIHFLLKHGATGINIVFDLPTIQEYDSDDPYAKGQVGLCGVAIDTVEDMKALFRGVPIDRISVSLTTHYPSNTMILTSMYLVMAEEMRLDWRDLRGTVQNDLVMEAVVRTAPDSLPPDKIFKLQVDNIEFIRKNVPKWNYVTFNGYNLREAGVDEVTEVAVAFSNAVESSLEMVRRGYHPDQFLDRMAFFWDIGNDFFAEIAKMRAARRLWYKITRYILGASNPRSWWCRFHVQTSGISLSREEPLNNIARSAFHALAAVLGGAQSLHVSGYDEAYSVPTELAHLISLRIQQIIQEEIGVTEVVDPMGGSYYAEWLTNQMEERIVGEMDEIWRMGGLVKAIEAGWLHRRIAEYAYEEQKQFEQGVVTMVGVNMYRAENIDIPAIDVFRYPEDAETRQRAKLETIRRNRDNEEVVDRLSKIVEAAQKNDNLFPYVVEAVRARATKGEIARTFKKAFGIWRVNIYI